MSDRSDKALAELRGLYQHWTSTPEEAAEWCRFFDKTKGKITIGKLIGYVRQMARESTYPTPRLANLIGVVRRTNTQGQAWALPAPELGSWVICVEAPKKHPEWLWDAREIGIAYRETKDPTDVARTMEAQRERNAQIYYGGRWQVVTARNRFEARAAVDPEYAEHLAGLRTDMQYEEHPAKRVLAALGRGDKTGPKRTGPPERTNHG